MSMTLFWMSTKKLYRYFRTSRSWDQTSEQLDSRSENSSEIMAIGCVAGEVLSWPHQEAMLL